MIKSQEFKKQDLQPQNLQYLEESRLLQIEQELRSKGSHVYRDSYLWLFQLSDSEYTSEPLAGFQGKIMMLRISLTCTVASTGSLQASESDISESCSQGESNLLQSVQKRKQDQAIQDLSTQAFPALHQKLIAAVKLSFIYSWGQNGHIPLDGEHFLSVSSEKDPLVQFSLHLRWLASGSLIALAFPEKLAVQSSIQMMTQQIQESQREASAGTRIKLAPFGHNATTTGEPNLKSKSWRQLLLAVLDSRGLKVSDDWTMVQVNLKDKLYTMPWPTQLCFQNSHSTSELPNDQLDQDLSSAEVWFQGKQNRQIAMESKAVRSLDKSTITESEMTHGFHAVDTQALASLYPTPPEAPMTEALMDEQEAFESTLPPNSEAREREDSLDAMDSSMFDANALTEDDFNFFDQPDEVAGLDQLESEVEAAKSGLEDAKLEQFESAKHEQPEILDQLEARLEPEAKLEVEAKLELLKANQPALETFMRPNSQHLASDIILLQDQGKVSPNQISTTSELQSKTSSRTLKSKYGPMGKFGSQLHRPSTHRPSTSRPDQPVEVKLPLQSYNHLDRDSDLGMFFSQWHH